MSTITTHRQGRETVLRVFTAPVAGIAVVALALAGCSQHQNSGQSSSVTASVSQGMNAPAGPIPANTPAGLTGWPTPAGNSKLTEEAIKDALLSESEAGKVIGTGITKSGKLTKPFRADDSSDASCDIVQGVTRESFGDSYEVFGGSGMQADDDNGDTVAIVYQTVAAYPDARTAHEQFTKAIADLTACNGKKLVIKPQGKELPVSVTVYPSTATRVSWFFRYDQTGARCYATFEGVGNGLVQVQICAASNTRSMTQDIADEIVDRLKLTG